MKKNQGITMVVLVITIIILVLLAGISIGTGNKVIRSSQLDNLKTNMLLIKAKGKENVEKANFGLGTEYDKVTDDTEKTQKLENAKSNLKGTEITDVSDLSEKLGITAEQFQTDKDNLIFYYKLSSQDLIDMGITKVQSDEKNGFYIIKYDIKNVQVEIYSEKGFSDNENTYYSLNEIEQLNI